MEGPSPAQRQSGPCPASLIRCHNLNLGWLVLFLPGFILSLACRSGERTLLKIIIMHLPAHMHFEADILIGFYDYLAPAKTDIYHTF
jgi:hypothetical protein